MRLREKCTTTFCAALRLSGFLTHLADPAWPAACPTSPFSRAIQHTWAGFLKFRKRPAYEGKSKHILILLSGPEPQRRVLADALWHQAQTVQEQIVFVEGRADATRGKIPPHIRYIPLAGGEALQVLLEAAEMVVCRSGYSTLMDLALLCKKAVLIPTPGQTEQEYLAAQGFWPSFPQKGFSLISGIAAARNAHAPDLLQDAHIMLPVIRKWLEGL